MLHELAKKEIYVREMAELSGETRGVGASLFFKQEVFRCLLPWQWMPSHPFPHLLKRAYMLVRAKLQRGGETAARHRAGAQSGIAYDRTCRRKAQTNRGSTVIRLPHQNSTRRIVPGLILDEVHAFG